MTKLICALFSLGIVATFIAQPVLAGGDKVRGEFGDGTVCQNQVVMNENGDPVFDGNACSK